MIRFSTVSPCLDDASPYLTGVGSVVRKGPRAKVRRDSDTGGHEWCHHLPRPLSGRPPTRSADRTTKTVNNARWTGRSAPGRAQDPTVGRRLDL